MVQAAGLDGEFFDLFPLFDDGCVAPEVSIRWCDVANALVVAMVVVIIHEGADLVFEIALQIVVFQQDPVLERLMPTLDLTLGLRVIGCTANVLHTLAFKPFGQIAGYIGRTIIAEQPGFMDDLGLVAA